MSRNSTAQQYITLNHYQIGRTIGKGTFGKVKLATHTLTGEKVAVKILEKDRIKDASDIERVSREIKILKQVNHPNIVKLYEIIETPKQLYLIMEYASGGELFDYIVARSRLKESQACVFLQQILAGVEYLQQIKVVHRDLKPENLLLDSRNNIKIVDFGLSNLYKADETLKTACGSPCYAAPEMIAGKRYHGSCVDIWSCGVVLFAMLNGYLPFEDPNTSALYKKIIAGEYKSGTWLTQEAQDILHKILNTNPESRFKIEQIRCHQWYQRHCQKPKDMPTIEGKVDEAVLKHMETLGLSIDLTRESLQKNKHNKFTSTYYLLLKKQEASAANDSLTAKIAASSSVNNPRGESHSINPRIKKIFEFKGVDKMNTTVKEGESFSIRQANKTVIREVHYIRPAPRRKIYGNTGYRDPRAASTGFQGLRTGAMYVPREVTYQIPNARKSIRPAHLRTPFTYTSDIANSLNITIRNQSPRAGTALDVSAMKAGPKNYTLR